MKIDSDIRGGTNKGNGATSFWSFYVDTLGVCKKPIGGKNWILTKHKQHPHENEVWNSQIPIFNLFLIEK